MILELNKCVRNYAAQLKKLTKYYLASKISVDHLVDQSGCGLKISADVINQFAVKVEDVKEGVTADKVKARILYEWAAKKGSLWGKYNLSRHYFNATGGVNQDIDKVFSLLEDARKNAGIKTASQLLLGRAYLKKKEYRKALGSFKKIDGSHKDYVAACKELKKLYQVIPSKL